MDQTHDSGYKPGEDTAIVSSKSSEWSRSDILWCTGIYIAINAIPITMIIMGAVYQDKCETQPNIPVFLIVGGGAASITFIIGGIFLLAYDSTDFRGKFVKILFGGLTLILLLFCFAWYITGCVWIYKLFRTMKKANYIKYLKKWGYPPCHKVLYWFAFAMLQASYLVIGPLFKLCK